jgi:hypothetical protein
MLSQEEERRFQALITGELKDVVKKRRFSSDSGRFAVIGSLIVVAGLVSMVVSVANQNTLFGILSFGLMIVGASTLSKYFIN